MASFLVSWSIDDLLLLRVLCDKPESANDLDRDIQDLYQFPERLRSSYPHEWRAYIRRRLRELELKAQDLPQDAQALVGNQGRPLCEPHRWQVHYNRFQVLSCVLREVSTLLESNNVSPLPTPLHRWLDDVLK